VLSETVWLFVRHRWCTMSWQLPEDWLTDHVFLPTMVTTFFSYAHEQNSRGF
jgi:hypothetical protein